MADYDTIRKGVDGADYVLHIAAMVSPAADQYPEQTLYTNIGSTLNIIKAIKESETRSILPSSITMRCRKYFPNWQSLIRA